MRLSHKHRVGLSILLIITGLVWSWFSGGTINLLCGFVLIIIGVVLF